MCLPPSYKRLLQVSLRRTFRLQKRQLHLLLRLVVEPQLLQDTIVASKTT